MATIVQTSEFERGLTSINTNKYPDLDTYITETKEQGYIKRILGTTLGQEFIDDLIGDPLAPKTPKWITIFNEFNYDVSGQTIYCTGLKEILIYLFYRDYVDQQQVINQSGGNMGVNIEASSLEGLLSKSVVIYNRGVMGIILLQDYVVRNSDTYTDFQGCKFEYNSDI